MFFPNAENVLELPGMPTLGRLTLEEGYFPMVLINDVQYQVSEEQDRTAITNFLLTGSYTREWRHHLAVVTQLVLEETEELQRQKAIAMLTKPVEELD